MVGKQYTSEPLSYSPSSGPDNSNSMYILLPSVITQHLDEFLFFILSYLNSYFAAKVYKVGLKLSQISLQWKVQQKHKQMTLTLET
jgi:hypothetical protein